MSIKNKQILTIKKTNNMKKSINKLNLNKITISNLQSAEMAQKVGGIKSDNLVCATRTLTGYSVCFTCSGCPIK
jgi:hypothetical protein